MLGYRTLNIGRMETAAMDREALLPHVAVDVVLTDSVRG
jgi:hypothetical protein